MIGPAKQMTKIYSVLILACLAVLHHFQAQNHMSFDVSIGKILSKALILAHLI